ncbi:nuclear factor 7, ovary-like [Pundamilia nyererei]|uniref:Nuclear factor 7, ovary-like n=1 Tax=Pundamilia nyererei TaxID=303518 RepID=A0A9Y3RJ25_9CICH|nr:PREDICTED: nuclear factor 7, ovary-like [Pundamilia nyererei]XP_039870085.1 nuclear factor 7, ovary-like [Simochromis diagramma]
MAFRSEEDLCCPACHDIFKDPVLLLCSHSFCKACLQSWWKEKQIKECLVCRTVCEWSDPPCNRALKNLCEGFLQSQRASSGSDSLCSLHSEKLKLFCLDHEQPACIICRDAKIHADHQFRPIDEVAQEHREELHTFLNPLQHKLKLFNEVKVNLHQTAEHIKVQALQIERRLKEQFKKLHQFLEEEEEERMLALREEEAQKSQVMKEKMEALCREMANLSDTVRATEEHLRAGDPSFLRTYKAVVERVQQHPQLDDPQLGSGALIDVAKHLGNLTFNIWNKMTDMVSYSPVILDPNSANPELILSEDLTGVRHGKRRLLPENPERFEFWDSVLGSEGFNSGTHSWDVEVGDNKDWEVGVIAESMCRREFVGSTVWSVECSHAGYRAFSPTNKYIALSITEKVKKVRVHLDWDEGKLSFLEPDTNTHIHTFTHIFTEKLCPYLCTRNPQLLKIVPVKVCVRKLTDQEE